MRNFLKEIFGSSVIVGVFDILCYNYLQESKSEKPIWFNLSELAKSAKISKSSVKRTIDILLVKDFILEKKIETHAKNPPRNIRLNENNPVIQELIFFYRKIRGFM